MLLNIIKKYRKLMTLLIILFFFSTNPHAVIHNWETEYLKVLDEIQQHSIRNFDQEKFDWKSYRHKMLEGRIINDRESFYKAIESAFKELNDKHSFLMPNNIGNKVAAGGSDAIGNPTIKEMNGIGIVTITGNFLDNPNDPNEIFNPWWVNDFYNKLAKYSHIKKGWILDLTKNSGGNVYPMLAVLIPFLQTEEVGGFMFLDKFNNKIKQKIFLHDGALYFDKTFLFQYPAVVNLNLEDMPIVVLIGAKTASSGEFIALTLKKQPNTIVFGLPTYGLANGNALVHLPEDLGFYMLASYYYLDENDEPLLASRISPDIEVNGNDDILMKYATSYINSVTN